MVQANSWIVDLNSNDEILNYWDGVDWKKKYFTIIRKNQLYRTGHKNWESLDWIASTDGDSLRKKP